MTATNNIIKHHSFKNPIKDLMLMIRFLKEIYLTAFVLINKLPTRKGNEFGRIGGAITIITLVEWLNLLTISSCIEIFFGKQMLPRFSEPEVFLSFFALGFLSI
jgi:hypothetical protein